MKHNDRRDLVAANKNELGLFDPFFDDFFRFPDIWDKGIRSFDKAMRTDVKEDEKCYTLEIDVPGIDKKDIGIELRDGYLTVSAHKEDVSEEKDRRNYVRRERHYGACSRSFYIGDIDEKDIEARLENGILSVCVPKVSRPDDNGAKRIEIK